MKFKDYLGEGRKKTMASARKEMAKSKRKFVTIGDRDFDYGETLDGVFSFVDGKEITAKTPEELKKKIAKKLK